MLSTLIPKASDYKVYTQIEHVLNAPEMYIDSPLPVPREEYLLINGAIRKVQVTIAMGAIRVFVEILANAIDNFSRSARVGVDPGQLVVTMNRTTISVENGGLPIPLQIHPEYGCLVPKILFGTMYSSSSYTEERHEIGRNGIGAKAAVIFSKKLTPEVWDPYNKKYWKATWINNMGTIIDEVFEDYHGTESKVKVTYDLDLPRFKLDGGYPDEAFYIIARLCADVSFTNKVPVSFNGTSYNYANIRDYVKLYFPESKNTIVYYQWPPGVIPIVDKDGSERPPNGYTLPKIELIAVDTPDEAFSISFANSLMTPDGGVHVENTIKALSDSIVTHVNEGRKRPGAKPGASKVKEIKKSKGKEEPKPKVNLADVRPHISVIVSIREKNLSFNSQTKTLLRGPDISVPIPPSILDKMLKWELADRLRATLTAKGYKQLKKTDGVKKKHLTDCKVDDCSFAGTNKSGQCTLMLFEGKSALQLGVILRGQIPNGCDTLGLMALRGKLINAINADPDHLAKNAEIKEIKRAMGLKEGAVFPQDANQLRYGNIMIAADQDVDGRHIKGLILTYLMKFFPTLVTSGLVCEYVTPYLRLYDPHGTQHKFYFEKEYESFRSQYPECEGKNWDYKYCKGLGSSSKEEIISDLDHLKIIQMICDPKCGYNMMLGFDGDPRVVDLRKKWVENHDINRIPQLLGDRQAISDYVNDELITYVLATFLRHIPRLADGMKVCQRKLLATAFKKFGRNLQNNKPRAVRTFCGSTIEETVYHHGEGLPSVLTNMSAGYVGTLNLPYFKPDAMLGCRIDGGKDSAAARYTSFKCEWWLPYIFRPEDDDILPKQTDEKKDIEPEYYAPIIPMQLVNGTNAIASSCSSFIPNFKPLDLVNAIREMIAGKELTPLVPWYRDFKGGIRILDRRKKSQGEAGFLQVGDDSDEDEYIIESSGIRKKDVEPPPRTKGGRYSMVTTGSFHMEKDIIVVTELPIGKWTMPYKKWLKTLIERKLLTDMRSMSTDTEIRFELEGFIGEVKTMPAYNAVIQLDLKKLQLVRSYGMSNMVLLDGNKKPIKYDSPEHIAREHFIFRLDYYGRRRLNILNKIREDIENVTGLFKYIHAVMNDRVLLWNPGTKQGRDEREVYREMDELCIDHKHYKNSKTNVFNTKKLASLQAKHAKLLQRYDEVEIDTPCAMWLRDLDEFEKKYRSMYKGEDATNHRSRGITIGQAPYVPVTNGHTGIIIED